MSAASPGTTFSKLLYEWNYLTSNEGFELGEVHPAEDGHDAVARQSNGVRRRPFKHRDSRGLANTRAVLIDAY